MSSKYHPLKPNHELAEQRRIQAFESELKEFGKLVMLSPTEQPHLRRKYKFTYRNYYLYVDPIVYDRFLEKFKPFLDGNNIVYDNLINICIMVKNAGPGFRDILIRNLPYIDRYTILDTGSTDETLTIAREVLAHKRGKIYEEPFQGFRLSRNRLLDLAGTDCFFNIMLDDTYVLNGNLREFLEIMRGDDVADSFSLVIDNCDTMYTSNRITKSDRGLRYIGDMHEIIQTENNFNAQVPREYGYIYDVESEYMKERTVSRKLSDIEVLMKMLEQDPENPRTYYYIADSYICLKDWVNAEKWFRKRSSIRSGNSSEIQDALYYIAVINDFYLGTEWSKVHQLYIDCYRFDTTRAEALYFIGSHYLKEGCNELAYIYLSKAFNLGFPTVTMSIRKNIYNYHIPNDLLQLTYIEKDYSLGLRCCERILLHKSQDENALKWKSVFNLIQTYNQYQTRPVIKQKKSEKKTIAIVAPGGWKKWDGETPKREGLGGSEIFCIGYAEALVKLDCEVFVFCNCPGQKRYNGVVYIPIEKYIEYLTIQYFDCCLISRYSEYIAVTCLSGVPKVYFVLHDLPLNCEVIPMESNLKNIFCLTDWHKQVFLQQYSICAPITTVISHGIDLDSFQIDMVYKIPYSFIYSSFPNRGLKELLEIFPYIRTIYPTAILNIFCDLDHYWVIKNYPEEIQEIKRLLEQQSDYVINHGWVSPKVLREYWLRTHVWLYPCVFPETACLTAYEAAASKVLTISNNNAGLENTISDRGIVVRGDPRTSEWKKTAIQTLVNILGTATEQELINKNYEWIKEKSYDKVANYFLVNYVL